MSVVLVLWRGLSLPCSEVDPSLWRKPRISYIPDNIGQLMTGSVAYRLRPGVGMQKVGSDDGYMGWLGVRDKAVDRVSNSTLAGITYIGEDGHATGIRVGRIGAGAGMGAAREEASAGVDTGAAGGGTGGG
jgi:hypothetical protein